MLSSVMLEVALATPVMLANQTQTAYLKVSLTGAGAPPSPEKIIAPLNLALVIDKSGSMRGQKIQYAKAALKQIVNGLQPADVLALINYDHHVEVLFPATPVIDKTAIYSAIQRLTAGGNSALYSGVERGAKEVRNFLSQDRVNRIILLSDGLANIGPDTPAELGQLGTELGRERIAVTTIGLGLGYHEDLLTQLASHSDGNHAFVEKIDELTTIFNHELNDLWSVVAQTVTVNIVGVNNVKPLRVLGRAATIEHDAVIISLNQLYREQEKYILLELQIPATPIPARHLLATVEVSYYDLTTHRQQTLQAPVEATFTASESDSKESIQVNVMATVIEQLALTKNQLAVKLRDQGQVEEAREVLLETAAFVKEQAAKYDLNLAQLTDLNVADAQYLEGPHWNRQRKAMRQVQYKTGKQQKY